MPSRTITIRFATDEQAEAFDKAMSHRDGRGHDLALALEYKVAEALNHDGVKGDESGDYVHVGLDVAIEDEQPAGDHLDAKFLRSLGVDRG